MDTQELFTIAIKEALDNLNIAYETLNRDAKSEMISGDIDNAQRCIGVSKQILQTIQQIKSISEIRNHKPKQLTSDCSDTPKALMQKAIRELMKAIQALELLAGNALSHEDVTTAMRFEYCKNALMEKCTNLGELLKQC